jgi:hypothetical protein
MDATADLIVPPMLPSVDVGAGVIVEEAELSELLPAAAATVWKVAPEVMLIPTCQELYVRFTEWYLRLRKVE